MAMKTFRNNQSGFTLIELIVVITIIAILSGVVVMKIIDKPGKARVVKAKADIAELSKALGLYKLDSFNYPTSDQGLSALTKKPTSDPIPSNYPQGGYLSGKGLPKDPWGNDYIYLSPGLHNTEEFDLYSLGADGVEGGEGENQDVTSWVEEDE